jgi:hypothetical protein
MLKFFILTIVALTLSTSSAQAEAVKLKIENINGKIHLTLFDSSQVVFDDDDKGSWNPEDIGLAANEPPAKTEKEEILFLKTTLVELSVSNLCLEKNNGSTTKNLSMVIQQLTLVPGQGNSLDLTLTKLTPNEIKCLKEEIKL